MVHGFAIRCVTTPPPGHPGSTQLALAKRGVRYRSGSEAATVSCDVRSICEVFDLSARITIRKAWPVAVTSAISGLQLSGSAAPGPLPEGRHSRGRICRRHWHNAGLSIAKAHALRDPRVGRGCDHEKQFGAVFGGDVSLRSPGRSHGTRSRRQSRPRAPREDDRATSRAHSASGERLGAGGDPRHAT